MTALASAGVLEALVMTTDARDNEGLLAAVRSWRGPVSLYFAAWVDPEDPDVSLFLERNKHDIAAIKVHPSFARRPITDPAFGPCLEYAEANHLPVIVHCGRWREVAGFELAVRAAVSHPGCPFILSHMGGDSPSLVKEAVAAVRQLANVYLGTESIREYWVIAEAIDALGPGRLVFGSDFNLNHPATFLATIRAIGLDRASEALILGDNARRLFRNRRPLSEAVADVR